VAGFSFDPNRVAHAEAAGWRAYYDHKWPKMLQLMMELSREQFHMPYPASILAAYYTVQAGRHWIPKEPAKDKAQYYLRRFYRKDPEKNWMDLEEKLRRCYRSIQEEMATGAESVELRAASNV
jgi:hypothetical protein